MDHELGIYNPRQVWLLMLLTLSVFVCGAVGLTVAYYAFTQGGRPIETVIVPFDEYEPTYTTNEYRGKVILHVSGTGQAAGPDYSDAFYQYTQGGRPLDPPKTEHFDLEIDGDRAIHTLGLTGDPPPYSPNHEYTVEYDVGPEPRVIAFRISDEMVGDNAGQFVIEIRQ